MTKIIFQNEFITLENIQLTYLCESHVIVTKKHQDKHLKFRANRKKYISFPVIKRLMEKKSKCSLCTAHTQCVHCLDPSPHQAGLAKCDTYCLIRHPRQITQSVTHINIDKEKIKITKHNLK